MDPNQIPEEEQKTTESGEQPSVAPAPNQPATGGGNLDWDAMGDVLGDIDMSSIQLPPPIQTSGSYPVLPSQTTSQQMPAIQPEATPQAPQATSQFLQPDSYTSQELPAQQWAPGATPQQQPDPYTSQQLPAQQWEPGSQLISQQIPPVQPQPDPFTSQQISGAQQPINQTPSAPQAMPQQPAQPTPPAVPFVPQLPEIPLSDAAQQAAIFLAGASQQAPQQPQPVAQQPAQPAGVEPSPPDAMRRLLEDIERSRQHNLSDDAKAILEQGAAPSWDIDDLNAIPTPNRKTTGQFATVTPPNGQPKPQPSAPNAIAGQSPTPTAPAPQPTAQPQPSPAQAGIQMPPGMMAPPGTVSGSFQALPPDQSQQIRDLVVSGKHTWIMENRAPVTAEHNRPTVSSTFNQLKTMKAAKALRVHGWIFTVICSVAVLGCTVLVMLSLMRAGDATQHQLLGQRYAEAGNNELAIQELTKAMELGCTDEKVVVWRAIAYTRAGHGDQALDDFNRLIGNTKNSPSLYVGRAAAYSKLKQHDKAIADCDKALQIDPNYTEALRSRANEFCTINAYDKAVKDCYEYMRITKEIPADIYALRAFASFKLKHPEKAIEDYSEAIRSNGENADYYVSRAECYKATKQYAKAINDVTATMRLAGRTEHLLAMRGALYRENGEIDKALADYEEAAKAEPSLANHDLCAKAAMVAGKFDKALHYLDLLVADKPDDKQYQDMRRKAWTEVKSKRHVVAAAEQFSPSKEPSLNNLPVPELINRGYQALQSDATVEAAQIFSLALTKEPRNPMARKYLCYALAKSGSTEEAYKQLYILESMGKATMADESAIAEELLRYGNPEKAALIFSKLLPADRKNFSIRTNLIRAHMATGQTALAQQLATEGLTLSPTDEQKGVLQGLLNASKTARPAPAGPGSQEKPES